MYFSAVRFVKRAEYCLLKKVPAADFEPKGRLQKIVSPLWHTESLSFRQNCPNLTDVSSF